jgi:hypothetical protein
LTPEARETRDDQHDESPHAAVGLFRRCKGRRLDADRRLNRRRRRDLDVAYEFETLPDSRTRITQCSQSRGKGIWWLPLMVLMPLIRKSASEATRKELEQRRAYCESGTPATPGGPPASADGRAPRTDGDEENGAEENGDPKSGD